MKIHIPKFEPLAKCNEYMSHEAFDIEIPDYVLSDVGYEKVTYCKDCKNWNNGDCYRLELSRPDDFCSYGERKEE